MNPVESAENCPANKIARSPIHNTINKITWFIS